MLKAAAGSGESVNMLSTGRAVGRDDTELAVGLRLSTFGG